MGALRDELVALLRRLIQADTVNPPGNETRATDVLQEYLEGNGVSCELYAKIPERANLVARIPGRDGGERLLLLSHTDTVLADPEEWSVDPWSAELRDDHVWGRGALDMKGQVAASAVAIASLAREGFEPAGDLIFTAAADEEVGEGEQFGLPWLVQEHPDAVEAEYAVNEGAGDRLVLGGTPYYFCSTAEKMASPFRLRVRGRSGHGSMPAIADNALVKAAKLIERLGEFKGDPQLGPEVEALLQTVLGEVPPLEQVLELARELSPGVAEMVEPLLSMTVAPTMIKASHKRNVIPGACEVTVDCRLLPGQTQEEAREILLSFLGEGDYELEWIRAYGGTRSPLSSPLWEAVSSFVEQAEPGAHAVPVCVAGFTDSHWLRQRFGTVAYGFFPMRAMDPELAARLIHSADERAAIEDLELGLDFLRHAAITICDGSR
jgi:acetylornithine deacetylase/succinyl-diaminopimelate desuccinylase-like protein